ncbi:TPA: GNAT family N-acetyltransferase [Methanosarcina acetivorans]|nr:GNAT family N-acetyltransferase [Methanosarcina acetivorans]HIH94398.1 GNAT family N-acetyltransferase [Methanosarcina acetivorans]
MVAIRNIMDSQKDKDVTIRTQKPGDAGYIAYRHCVLYEKEYGLGGTFEHYVLDSFAKYIEHRPAGEIWVAECNGQIVGSIGIVSTDKSTAQLRWFLIEPEFRGIGLGRQLMIRAVDYCKQKKFSRVFLWTIQSLKISHHLYSSFGFIPVEQAVNNTWKKGVVEERWELLLKPA